MFKMRERVCAGRRLPWMWSPWKRRRACVTSLLAVSCLLLLIGQGSQLTSTLAPPVNSGRHQLAAKPSQLTVSVTRQNSLPRQVPHDSQDVPLNKEDPKKAILQTDLGRADFELEGCKCRRKYNITAYSSLNGTRSSCGQSADYRGRGQRVISFSFYGNTNSSFFAGIERNLQAMAHIYPGWVMRVYYDVIKSDRQSKPRLCDVICRYDYVDLCDARDLPGLGDLSGKFGMIWRFMPLGDETVERFIVRDLDSTVSQRERDAVDEWIGSGRSFHAMRDNPQHVTEILGGLWGGWNRFIGAFQRIRRRIIKVTHWHYKGLDQRVLSLVVWPEAVKQRDILCHDSYLCTLYPFSRPFPSRRIGAQFVGAARSVEAPKPPIKCPYSCRPAGHKDWLSC